MLKTNMTSWKNQTMNGLMYLLFKNSIGEIFRCNLAMEFVYPLVKTNIAMAYPPFLIGNTSSSIRVHFPAIAMLVNSRSVYTGGVIVSRLSTHPRWNSLASPPGDANVAHQTSLHVGTLHLHRHLPTRAKPSAMDLATEWRWWVGWWTWRSWWTWAVFMQKCQVF